LGTGFQVETGFHLGTVSTWKRFPPGNVSRNASPRYGEDMNRVILLLNTGILVVMFILALSTTDSQIGLMHSAASMRAMRPQVEMDTSVAFLKVV